MLGIQYREILVPIISLIALIAIYFILNKRLYTNIAIVFSPILTMLMMCLANLASAGSFFEILKGEIQLVIFLFTVVEFIFYIMFLFEKIAEASENNREDIAIFRIAMMVISCCIFFAVIYFIYYRISENTAFNGNIGDDWYFIYVF